MVLLVHDSQRFSQRARRLFKQLTSAYTIEEGIMLSLQHEPMAIMIGERLDGEIVLSTIPYFLKVAPAARIYVLAGHVSETSERLAMKLGAYAYVESDSIADVVADIQTTFSALTLP